MKKGSTRNILKSNSYIIQCNINNYLLAHSQSLHIEHFQEQGNPQYIYKLKHHLKLMFG